MLLHCSATVKASNFNRYLNGKR